MPTATTWCPWRSSPPTWPATAHSVPARVRAPAGSVRGRGEIDHVGHPSGDGDLDHVHGGEPVAQFRLEGRHLVRAPERQDPAGCEQAGETVQALGAVEAAVALDDGPVRP